MGVKGGWLLKASPTEVLKTMRVDEAIDEGVAKAAAHLQQKWKEVLSQPGSGTHWTIDFRVVDGILIPIAGGDGEPNPSSLPNQFPAPQTGELRDSISVLIMPSPGDFGSMARVGPAGKQDVARVLEFGAGPEYPAQSPAVKQSGDPVVIHPRPHARVAMRMAQEGIREEIGQGVKTTLHVPTIQTFDLSQIRDKLLDVSSFLGNLQALGIAPNKLMTIRSGVLGVERVFGDVESAMDGNFSGRLKRRAFGKYVAGKSLQKMVPAGGGNRFGKRVVRNALGGQTSKIIRSIE